MYSNNQDFYPTPAELAEMMAEKIRLIPNQRYDSYSILEPSAGKGDLLRPLEKRLKSLGDDYHVYRNLTDDMDVCEIDPELQNILQGDETLPEHRLIASDFLTLSTFKHYDLIFANFPFSKGEHHLHKAIEMQKRYGGQLICLVNAETIRNPYTVIRQDNIRQLEDAEAEITFLQNAFLSGERPTDVEVALIDVTFPEPTFSVDITSGMNKAQDQVVGDDDTPKDLTQADFVQDLIARFNLEIQMGCDIFRDMKKLSQYALPREYNKDILELNIENINKYIESVRYKYWSQLFDNPNFVQLLTSNLREQLQSSLSEMKHYDLTEYNIKQLLKTLNGKLLQGVEDTIVSLFDKLSQEHSWIDGSSKNIHYYNGWKTNLAHKINKRVIIPAYDCFYSYSGELYAYKCFNILGDIEKALNYLDMGRTPDITLGRTDSTKFDGKYFTAKFYKKGTCHITFTCPELLEKLNLYGSQKKGWLPPNYGKKHYADMSAEEQAVVDSFQGEAAYEAVLEDAQYYLQDPTQSNALCLSAGN